MSFPDTTAVRIAACALLAMTMCGCERSEQAAPEPAQFDSASAPAPSVEMLTSDISKRGAKAVVSDLWSANEGRAWETVLSKVESGDSTWVELAGKLGAGTDAGASTGLRIAIATALPRNPAAVLTLVDSQSFLGIDQVCGAPFIEPEIAFVLRHLDDAKQAVSAMPESAGDTRRTACLQSLERTLERVRSLSALEGR